MKTYVGSRSTIKLIDNNDVDYLDSFNDDTLKVFANMSFVDSPINAATEVLDGTITSAKFVNNTIETEKLAPATTFTTFANNVYFKGRNFANNSDKDQIKINTSDLLQHGIYWEGLRLAPQKTLGSRTTGAADVNWMKQNSDDHWELLTQGYGQHLFPKADSLYFLGKSDSFFSKAYFDNLRISDYTASSDFYAAGSWTPVLVGAGTAGVGTYTNQIGYYVRIGRLMFIIMTLDWSGHTGVGSFQVTGLPAAAASVVTATFSNSMFVGSLTLPATTQVLLELNSGSSTLQFAGNVTNAGQNTIDVDTAAGAHACMWYFVD